RGKNLTDIDPVAYERILTDLAKIQGVGGGPPSFVKTLLGIGERPGPQTFEDPWSAPVGRADGLLIRAKCAPHFRRILYEMSPSSPLLRNYAHGSCPAGKYYCRITPEGDVTPCPYMPLAVGSLRERSFADLWRTAPLFARGMVIKAVEAYARGRGETIITKSLLADVRSKWGSRFRPQS